MRTFNAYSLSNFQIFNTTPLTAFTMLYITSPWFVPFDSLHPLCLLSTHHLWTTNVFSAIHIISYPLSLAVIAWPFLNVTKSFSKTGFQMAAWSPLIFAILSSTGSLMSLTAPCFPLPLPLKCWRSSEFYSIGPCPFPNSPRAVPSTPTASATESFNEMYTPKSAIPPMVPLSQWMVYSSNYPSQKRGELAKPGDRLANLSWSPSYHSINN